MRRLIEEVIGPELGLSAGDVALDSALLDVPKGHRLALTTDSYVVRPLFFPGSDIGALAVNGTVNDLAVSGARPSALSVGLIAEEGLEVARLRAVLASMRRAAEAAGVRLVTGDTKVVERGKGDELFVNTSGIGWVPDGRELSPARIRPGDVVLVSGDLGRHGVAIACAREGLALESRVESDCAPLAAPVEALFEAGVEVRCLRDLTRGGLVAALVELASSAGVRVELEEAGIPVSEPVQSVCELLGLDPLHLANEGRLVAIVAEASAQHALDVLRTFEPGASLCGQVGEPGAAGVPLVCRTRFGSVRALDLPSGDPLPRIC
jgi:hydrogenase expression/formation protein HypE